MDYRYATPDDTALLATLNQQLIQDERHRNSMSLVELETRMRRWLATGYTAVLFSEDGRVVAYALYRQDRDGIYLRQFFVDRQQRRRGVGKRALSVLRAALWPPEQRITVEVLAHNRAALDFWRACGFRDYALTLELPPEQS